MLTTLLFSLAAVTAPATATPAAVDTPQAAGAATPAVANPAASTPAFDLPCLYADRGEGGGLEAADACARRDGDTLVIRPGMLARMDFGEGGLPPSGLSPLFTDRSWHWVRRDGYAVPVVTFDNMADDFVEGLARGPWRGGMAYYDTQLNRVLALPYDWVDRFENGVARVCKGCWRQTTPDGEHGFMTGGQWGAIDRQGRLAQPLAAAPAAR